MKILWEIAAFVKRERFYTFLLIFAVLANLSLSLLNNVIKGAQPSKVFSKEVSPESSRIFDHQIMEAIISKPAVHALFTVLIVLFLFFIAAGLIIDAVFLYKKAVDRNPIGATQAVGPVGWGFWDVCKVIIIFFFAESAASLGAIYAAFILPGLHIDHSLLAMFASTLLDIVVVAAVFYFALWNNSRNFQDLSLLGLTTKRIFLNIRYGIAAYMGLIPVFLVVTVLTSVLFRALNIPIEPQEMVEILKKEKSLPSLIYMCAFASFLGPVMEEIFFRGFVYGALKKKTGIGGGILISALFFAYVHANMASFMPILTLGIFLAYIYEKTGSLVSSVTVHMMHNSLMLMFLLFFKAAAN